MADARESIIARLKKIRALAEEGIDGERVAAQRQLERLLAEHGLTLDELSSEDKRVYSVGYRSVDERKLFAQICAQVFDSHHPDVTYKQRARIVFITCTAAQWADIKDRFAHYVRQLRNEKAALRKQARLLASAMIQKHGIFPASDSGAEEVELTEAQRQELRALFKAMQTLSTTGFVAPVPRLEQGTV